MAMLLRTRKFALAFRIIFVISITVTYVIIGSLTRGMHGEEHFLKKNSLKGHQEVFQPSGGRHLLQVNETEPLNNVPNIIVSTTTSTLAPFSLVNSTVNETKKNCTPPAIHEFPSDGFTREQRQAGWAFLHVGIACYLFILLALVCDDYFVPAIKRFCDSLKMTEDVAGATFMATASSSPELFINCVGTFVTEGDLGVGTIVGSAVFNVLAVPACCGLFANMVLQLDWWPITRDSSMYGVAVMMLIGVLNDEKVELFEAGILVGAYFFYIGTMVFNECITKTARKLARLCRRQRSYKEVVLSETQPLLSRNGSKDRMNGNGTINPVLVQEVTLQDVEDLEESTNIWEWPSKQSSSGKCWWVFTWPISFVLFLTTPDCRKYPKLYVVTFLMCIFWIGTTSYTVAWLITVVGDTLNIPDSVMGLTFLAAGTSVPEAVSSVIVTNQGHGGMGLSSSLGSNTFDILLCLGLPWLIKTWFYSKDGLHAIYINSSGLTYSAISLLSTLVMFYLSLVLNKFKLDWKIGLTCLMMYIGFLLLASLIELNVFFPVNLPTCDR